MAPNKVVVVVAILFSVVVLLGGGGTATLLCKVDTKELALCKAAVTPPDHGQPLPLPTSDCCSVVGRANLTCLCNLKSVLPAMGINPANALGLPSKCGLPIPSACHI